MLNKVVEKIKNQDLQILLVDDDSVDRESVKRALNLQYNSHVIREAENVDNALELLKLHKFDVILLDYKLPQKDGIELLFELRQLKVSYKPAIIMMSTTEDEMIILKCIEAGAQDFIPKLSISQITLKRAILNAMIRYTLENKLKSTYDKVKHLSEYDHLSGLCNRYAFDSYLKDASEKSLKSNTSMTLMLLDLDHFKTVNDRFGHVAGDSLLANFSKRIGAVIASKGLFARVGGDEFAVVIESNDSEQIAKDLAISIIANLAKPLTFNGLIEVASVSIGLASITKDANDSTTLFKYADMALYDAKKQGRNQYQQFNDSMEQVILKKAETEKLLSQAIDRSEFILLYQPIFDGINSKVLTGFEALIRWKNNGIVMPDEFIPVAEETKLIKKIGRWVIYEAIKQLNQWNSASETRFTMSINLSAVQLEDLQLREWIIDCVNEFAIDFNQLEFELTETALLDNQEIKIDILNQIVNLGCSLALDDFGTGFSSLSHLKNFPISTVKIDKSMLPEDSNNFSAFNLFKGLCSLIHALNLEITVEGVETEGHRDLCQSMKVNRLQGYLLGRPVNQASIEQNFFKKVK